MPIREEAAETDLSLVEGPEESWSLPEAPPRAKPDRRSLYEREQARAAAAEARVQELLNDIRRLRTALRKAEAGKGATEPLSSDAGRLHKALEESRTQKDTIKLLRAEIGGLRTESRRLRKAVRESENGKGTIRALNNRIERLHELLGTYRDQRDEVRVLSRLVDTLSEDVGFLRPALKTSEKERKALASRVRVIEPRLANNDAQLRATGAALSKALFGRKSEQQEKPRSGRPRGQQRGAPGHGRTQRPGLEERTEERNPPEDARVCSCCGMPYTANGAEESTIVEIEVKAHKRRIVRPRWRRTCECASSPQEVSAPPLPRLFDNTPYGISVWARFLFERYACDHVTLCVPFVRSPAGGEC